MSFNEFCLSLYKNNMNVTRVNKPYDHGVWDNLVNIPIWYVLKFMHITSFRTRTCRRILIHICIYADTYLWKPYSLNTVHCYRHQILTVTQVHVWLLGFVLFFWLSILTKLNEMSLWTECKEGFGWLRMMMQIVESFIRDVINIKGR